MLTLHQAHKEICVGWGNHTDFQFFIENFQFLVQWYDSHIMNIISCDDNFLWWMLMFGYLQLRKWDPWIIFSNKWCWNSFSLKGVQCKQWDPGIACFGENLHDGFMEKVNHFAQWIHAPVLLHDEQIRSTLECFCLRTSKFGRGGLSCPHTLGN